MIVLEVFVLCLIVCYVVDISGVVDSIKYAIWRWVFNGKREYEDFRLKPFGCSRCMCFWSGLIYIAVAGYFNIWMIGLVCSFSMLSDVLTKLLNLVVIWFNTIEDKILNKII